MDRLAAAGRSRVLQVFVSGLVFGCLHFYAFAGLIMAASAISGKGLAGAGYAPLAGHCSQEDPSADDSSASWEECPHRQEQLKQ
ncbi:hypothetical protein [Sinomonas sp. RB5]